MRRHQFQPEVIAPCDGLDLAHFGTWGWKRMVSTGGSWRHNSVVWAGGGGESLYRRRGGRRAKQFVLGAEWTCTLHKKMIAIVGSVFNRAHRLSRSTKPSVGCAQVRFIAATLATCYIRCQLVAAARKQKSDNDKRTKNELEPQGPELGQAIASRILEDCPE